MNRIKFYRIFSLFCIIFTLVIISQNQSYNSDSFSNNAKSKQGFHVKASSNNPIISINSNYELNQTATSGNGTLLNPYVIEGFTINGNGSLYCILINNTDKFFIIRDCTIFNSTYGIYLNNVSNGEVSLNSIFSNLITGLFMKYCFNNSILLNSVYGNKVYGIFIQESNFTQILGNHLNNNNFAGMFLNYSHFNDITLNSINGHQNAIIMLASNYSSVISNNGINNNNDIKQINCTGNTLGGNSFRVVSRENSSGESKSVIHIADFTIILLLCIFGFLAYFMFYIKRQRVI